MTNQATSPVQQEPSLSLQVTSPQQKSSRRVYPTDIKRAAVCAVVEEGKTYRAAVEEFDISSVSTLKKWLIAYRREGEAALEPKPLGRPRGCAQVPSFVPVRYVDEALLRMENEKLFRKLGGSNH